MKYTHLHKSDLHRRLFQDVVFFMYGEPGSMPGGDFYFITRSGGFYGFNYLYDDIELNDIYPLFPTLAQCRFGLFGQGNSLPAGWEYFYLGVGRHLVIEESVFPDFQEQLLDYDSVYEVSRDLPEIAERCLGLE